MCFRDLYQFSMCFKDLYQSFNVFQGSVPFLSRVKRGDIGFSFSVCPSVRQHFLFRARSPILLGGIEWNLAQWKNIYCSCAPGYRFYRAAKNVPVGLDRKSRFFLIMGLSYSALDLRHYLEESNKTWHSERIYIAVVHLGIGFIEQRKMCL